MNLSPGPAPRTPKGAFFIADGFLLLIAFMISWTWDADKPPVFAAIIACVLLAAVIGILPFILDWVSAQSEAVREERERTADQIARLEAAAENLARAAAQIKAVEESVHKAAKEAETLPYRMQEKLAEFNEALAEKENEQREALEQELTELRAAHTAQLKAAAEKISSTVSELSAADKAAKARVADVEAAADKLSAAGVDAAGKIDAALAAALTQLDAKIADLAKAAAATEKPSRRAKPEPAPEPVAVESPAEPDPAPAAADPAEAPAAESAATEPAPAEPAPADEAASEPPKPRKPRAPKKPKPEDIMAAMSEEPVSPPADSDTPAEAAPPPESSASSDGATRLLATAYIGIGNKLFIRGDGPGLNWDVGVPMQFVSIGKWGWFTHEGTGPVRVMLYKNDETPALSGEITLEPGKHTEVTAQF